MRPDTSPATDSPQAPAPLPRHVAIIMDGNGRWAQARGLSRIEGHRAGHLAVRGIVRAASDLGIQALTLYTFSSENWRRPPEEVEALMLMIEAVARLEIDELDRENVRIIISGDRAALPPSLQQELERDMALTADNAGLTLNLAINYGARAELARAARQLAHQVKQGLLEPDDIGEAAVEGQLYTAGLPEVDLLIRTGGEQRLSNFLLWQSAYTEFYFTPALWPDFGKPALLAALEEFARRERRFGDTGPRTAP